MKSSTFTKAVSLTLAAFVTGAALSYAITQRTAAMSLITLTNDDGEVPCSVYICTSVATPSPVRRKHEHLYVPSKGIGR